MITIDPMVFAYDEDQGLSYETFAVVGDIDGAAEGVVVAALNRAITRLMCVGENGVEYADQEAAASAGEYTANYASDPERTGNGIEVYLDCKGAIEPPMEETLRRVLREELDRLDLTLTVRPVMDVG
jgi:hypothetical protein